MIKGKTAWAEIPSLTRNVSDPSAEEVVHTKALLKKSTRDEGKLQRRS